MFQEDKMVMVANKTEITNGDLELIKQFCLPHKIIRQNMNLTKGALDMRTKRLMDKMGVENRTALVVMALKLGLVTIDELSVRTYG
jgi:hypothetical protein